MASPAPTAEAEVSAAWIGRVRFGDAEFVERMRSKRILHHQLVLECGSRFNAPAKNGVRTPNDESIFV